MAKCPLTAGSGGCFVFYERSLGMKISEIEKIARSKGIKDTWLYSKRGLIKAIQKKEGNYDCFGTAVNGSCNQLSCCWRQDCLE